MRKKIHLVSIDLSLGRLLLTCLCIADGKTLKKKKKKTVLNSIMTKPFSLLTCFSLSSDNAAREAWSARGYIPRSCIHHTIMLG